MRSLLLRWVLLRLWAGKAWSLTSRQLCLAPRAAGGADGVVAEALGLCFHSPPVYVTDQDGAHDQAACHGPNGTYEGQHAIISGAVDPFVRELILMRPEPDAPPGEVVELIPRGLRIGDTLRLRFIVNDPSGPPMDLDLVQDSGLVLFRVHVATQSGVVHMAAADDDGNFVNTTEDRGLGPGFTKPATNFTNGQDLSLFITFRPDVMHNMLRMQSPNYVAANLITGYQGADGAERLRLVTKIRAHGHDPVKFFNHPFDHWRSLYTALRVRDEESLADLQVLTDVNYYQVDAHGQELDLVERLPINHSDRWRLSLLANSCPVIVPRKEIGTRIQPSACTEAREFVCQFQLERRPSWTMGPLGPIPDDWDRLITTSSGLACARLCADESRCVEAAAEGTHCRLYFTQGNKLTRLSNQTGADSRQSPLKHQRLPHHSAAVIYKLHNIHLCPRQKTQSSESYDTSFLLCICSKGPCTL